MKYVVPLDEAAFTADNTTVLMAGPATGLDSCEISSTRLPAGKGGSPLHVDAVDHFYFVMEGSLELEIGTDKVTVGPDTLVRVPAGTPHRHANVSAASELHLEIYAPAPPKGHKETPAQPRKVDKLKSLIYPITSAGYETGGFAVHELVMRKTGSDHLRLYCAKVESGSGGPALHFHRFDQLYFILDGSIEVTVGLDKFPAKARSLVVLPASVVHTNRNTTIGLERHLAMMLPEPMTGDPLEYFVDVSSEKSRRA